MLSSKIKDLKIRKKFSKAEKLKKVEKFIFINTLNKKSLNYNNKEVVAFTLKKLILVKILKLKSHADV